MIDRFNIRVYMLIQSGDQLLISDEIIRGEHYTKFPGGGLEYGEGMLDCLHREAIEEFGQAVKNPRHFYTTEFFQRSAFRPEDQIISVYYQCEFDDEIQFRMAESKFDFVPGTRESFRWVKLAELSEAELSFPIDKEVLRLLQA
jgi:8-oxo-dGTP diphosphatase